MADITEISSLIQAIIYQKKAAGIRRSDLAENGIKQRSGKNESKEYKWLHHLFRICKAKVLINQV